MREHQIARWVATRANTGEFRDTVRQGPASKAMCSKLNAKRTMAMMRRLRQTVEELRAVA